jgi:hypothetical protein
MGASDPTLIVSIALLVVGFLSGFLQLIGVFVAPFNLYFSPFLFFNILHGLHHIYLGRYTQGGWLCCAEPSIFLVGDLGLLWDWLRLRSHQARGLCRGLSLAYFCHNFAEF